MEDKDVPEFEDDDPFVDVINIKQNGLIEITGMAVKNKPDVRIKWTVIDGVKKAKSDFEKDVSRDADTVTSLMREGSPERSEDALRVSQGSHDNSAVKSGRSALGTFSLLKMMRFIGENAQISYSGGISAIVGVVPSLLQPAGAKPVSVDYLRMVALASSCLFAAISWMLTISKSKKDLGIIAAACAFFSMIFGLFSAIFSLIVPEYRACLISIFMFFLLVVAFYASGDQDIETICESFGDPGPSSNISSSLYQGLLGNTSNNGSEEV